MKEKKTVRRTVVIGSINIAKMKEKKKERGK